MVFNNYIAHFDRIFQSTVCCLGIRTMFARVHGLLQLVFGNYRCTYIYPTSNSSIFKGTIWPNLDKIQSVHNAPYPTMRLATLAFSYMPLVMVLPSIMVSTTGQLIASIHESIPHGLWEDPL